MQTSGKVDKLIYFFQEFDSKRKKSEQRGNKSKTWFVLD